MLPLSGVTAVAWICTMCINKDTKVSPSVCYKRAPFEVVHNKYCAYRVPLGK